jgi:thiol-disulfide isomerase/thioredoxin
MNKAVIGGILAVVVIIGAGIYVAQQKTHDAAMMAQNTDTAMKSADAMSDKAMTAKGDTKMMTKDTMMTHAGSYEAYSPEKIAMKAATGKVVLFFHASWCPTCRAVDADIKAHLSSIPEKLTILDVDYDSSTDLKIKYGVTIQHTFVEVDAQGNLVKKWTGSPTLAALVAEVQ